MLLQCLKTVESAAYNKCINKLFGYARCDMCGISIELGLLTANAVVQNSHVLLFSVVLFSLFEYVFKDFLLFYGLRSEKNVDDVRCLMS